MKLFHNKNFTDVDFELYGLSIEEIAVVRSAFNVAQKKIFEELCDANDNLSKLVECAKKSSELCERVVL